MARGMMSNLTTPAFLVDTTGTLIFFNEAAGEVLGLSYEEAGPMAAQEWGTRFEPLDSDGNSIAVEDLPLAIAVSQGRPGHKHMRIKSATGDERDIEVSAFPIVGRTGQRGAMAIFWGWDTS